MSATSKNCTFKNIRVLNFYNKYSVRCRHIYLCLFNKIKRKKTT